MVSHTLFCEIEAILKNRPIATTSSDLSDFGPLNPNHILLLNSKCVLPPGEFTRADLYARCRWKQVQYLADLFWRWWTQEYLTLDPSSPRSSWPLKSVLETKPESKGLFRKVKLKTKISILEWPITKLCQLLEEQYVWPYWRTLKNMQCIYSRERSCFPKLR